MPDFDFDAFNHDNPEGEGQAETAAPAAETPAAPQAEIAAPETPAAPSAPVDNGSTEEVDKW